MDELRPSETLRLLRTHSPPLWILALLIGLCGLAVPDLAGAEDAGSDPEALRVADRLMTALGGEEAWQATRFFDFEFLGRRHHVWDKHTGRHRVEGESREGDKYVVLHNISERGEGGGKVFVNGEPMEGEARREWLQNAYAYWINDTYWLVMPYKLQDPGVHLASEGTEEIDGQTYDVMRLSFDQVGLTPGDRYWAYVNRDTGLMDRWAFHLQNMTEEEPRSAWDWVGWTRHGDIQLSPTRKQVGGDRELSLAPIAVRDSVPDSVFEEP